MFPSVYLRQMQPRRDQETARVWPSAPCRLKSGLSSLSTSFVGDACHLERLWTTLVTSSSRARVPSINIFWDRGHAEASKQAFGNDWEIARNTYGHCGVRYSGDLNLGAPRQTGHHIQKRRGKGRGEEVGKMAQLVKY